MIDVVTVGAGGGSVAWISAEGLLKVGPRSAGADPGPICYGKGGTEPTVTDAHLLLGRIPPHLLGGEIPLDATAARAGLEVLAASLHLDVEHAATGILEISAWNQANALRQVTVQRGLDVRDFTMVTFGGSGSLLACRLMDVLGIPRVLVPLDPGNLSAFGLLTVDVKNDYVRTSVQHHTDLDVSAVQSIYDDLTAQASHALAGEGFASEDRRFTRTADLRYFGQAFEVRVELPDGVVDFRLGERVASAFHDAHEGLYGYCFRDDPRQPVEWVNLRVSGIGPIPRPRLPRLSTRTDSAPSQTSTRSVWFNDAYVRTPVYWRPDLLAGDGVTGPCVVEEFGSTVPVHPGFVVRVDHFGNLLISRKMS